MTKVDIYQSVTDTIVSALEKGVEGGFKLPWHGVSLMPENAKTSNIYRGVNVPLLWAHQVHAGYQSGTWATYKQWLDMGVQVRRGEKGAPIVFWKVVEGEPQNDNEEASNRMFARWSKVFKADQVDGFEAKTDFVPSQIESIGAADALIDAIGADIRYGGAEAFYCPSGDYIQLPCPERFKETYDTTATENFYSTIFHELVHLSGAKHRLDRLPSDKFSKSEYAFEELVAELGAAMACASTGVESVPREDHARYIQSWLKALKDDKKFIFSAASHAQKALDYLYTFTEQQGAA